MKTVYITMFAGGLALLTGCQSTESKTEQAPEPRVEQNKLVLPAGSAQLSTLAIESVQPQAATTLRFNGRLIWDDNVTVRIYSPFAGRVSRIAAEPGQALKQGDTLALIASPDFGQAQADARKATTDYILAERTVSRIRDLFEHGAAAQKELQSAEADVARALSEKQRTEARLALYGNTTNSIDQLYMLKTPLDGIVVEKNINPGQEVRSDQMLASSSQLFSPLFVVTDPTRLWLLLDLNEHQLADIKAGQELVIRAAAYPDQEFHGKIDFVSDYLDSTTRTIKVRASVDNSSRALKAEMLVRAELSTAHPTGLNISSSAVFLRGDKHYVFVEEERGTFSRREVKIGPEQGDKVAVLEGVQPGQRVVTGNCLLLEQIFNSAGG